MKVNIGPYKSYFRWYDPRTWGERRVEIHIDKYDTWNLDDTLARIILPCLVQLKETTHGAPSVDPEDVPFALRPSKCQIAEYEKGGKTDELFFDRWDYVLDEMIWTFDHIANKEWEDGLYTPELNIEAYTEIHKRISNGLRLFAKYYQGLWD